MTLRDDLLAIADPKERLLTKVQAIYDNWIADWPVSGTRTIRRRIGGQNLDIVFLRPPVLVRNASNEVVGIDILINVFRGQTELQIDPHRIIVNPPILVPDGGTEQYVDEYGVTQTRPTFKVDVREAFLSWLADTITNTPNPTGWRTVGTVATVYADTSDGDVYSDDATYSVARAGTGTLSANSSSVSMYVGQSKPGNYRIFEAFLSFDTSVLGIGSTVSAVTLSLDGYLNNSDTDFTVNARTKDWGASVDTGDWVAGASLSALTLLATWDTSGYSSGYNAFTENGTNFQSAIQVTGTTRLMLSSSRHEGNNTPTGSGREYVQFSSANTAGTTADPKLDITYTEPPGQPMAARATLVPGMRQWYPRGFGR